MAGEPHESAPLDAGEILRVLVRRKWLLVLPWACAVLLGVVAAFVLKPIYYSAITLRLEQPLPLTGQLGEMVGNASNVERQADQMRQQVQSSAFLHIVLKTSGVLDDPSTRAWALQSQRRAPGVSSDESIESFLIGFVRANSTVRRDRGDVFMITVGDHQPHRAKKLAQAIADQFVLLSKQAQIEAVQATQDFSVSQQQVYKAKLDDSEHRLEAAQNSALAGSISGSTVNSANLGNARALLDQRNSDISQARGELATMRAQFQSRGIRENDPNQLNGSEVSRLSGQLAGLERQIAAATLNAGPGSADNSSGPRQSFARASQDLETALEQKAAISLPSLSPDARDLLVRYRLKQADLSSMEAGADFLQGQVGGYQRQIASGPMQNATIERLKQEVEADRALYNSFVEQSTSAQINEALQRARANGRFVILEPATLPLSPGKPNRGLLFLLSFVLGGIIGVGAVLVVEQHDQSVKNAEEVEDLVGLPVLGAVPRVDELERQRQRGRSATPAAAGAAARDTGLLHRLKVESALGLEFRRIYLKLAKTRGRSLPHTLLVTSATRGEGKTTTTACLGITLARELHEKVLLVDFDLRSPSLHRALGLPSSSWGLAQILQQRSFDERFVRTTVLPHLDFLGAGKSERPPSELIDTEAAEWFIQQARSRYSIVVIDAAPNLAVPDALMIGRAVEGVLYVVKAGSTVRKAAEYGVKVQREARDNVLGVLMNDVGEIMPQYYGYRSNTYGYNPEVAGGES